MRGEGRSILLVVLDGVADRPAPSLDGHTPLEAAETPNLDRLAAAGVSGTMDVGDPGTPMSSDRAHAVLFDYDPSSIPRRGVLEARGFDVPVPPGGVACSASFARGTSDGNRLRVTDRSVADAHDRCDGLEDRVTGFRSDGVAATFTHTWKNRGILTLDGDVPLSADVTDVDPFEDGLHAIRSEPTDGAAEPAAAATTADALAAYTRWTVDRLADAPVDVVLAKWAGTATNPPTFAEVTGMDGATLTRKPVLRGLGQTLSLTVERPPDEYDERAETVLRALDRDDFVHAHYPEPDEVAHDEDPPAKRREVEAIDDSLAPVVDRALDDDGLVVAVTADHTTPSRGNVVHSGEPVPITVVGQRVRTDDVAAAGERPAAEGGLGRIDGRDCLRLLRSAADRVLLDGLRRTPAASDRPTTDLRPLDLDE